MDSIRRWVETWQVLHLLPQTRIELSSRLTQSLARCYPERRLIRIVSHRAHAGNGLLHEVLCHELADLAACVSSGLEGRLTITRQKP